MLNLYYIVDPDTWKASINLFHPQLGSHWIPLPNGKLLVSCHFPPTHANVETWEHQANVSPLPHPIFEGTKPLSDEHVAALSHLGIKTGHTVLDVAGAAAKLHPLMKLRHF